MASRLPNLLDHGPLPVSGPGNATLNYQVAANGSGTPRRGSTQIGGVIQIIEQAFSLSCTTAPTALSASSCSSPLRGNTRAARYSFAGVASQQITLQLASTAFDAYLYLVRPDGTILAEDDDGGGNLNSRIPANSGFIILLATGTYLIEAIAFDATAFDATALDATACDSTACNFAINPTALSEAALNVQRNVTVSTPAGWNWAAVSQTS